MSGKGVFYCGGRELPVSAGQGFLIVPGEETWYQADTQEPWHYSWVGFRGAQAEYLVRAAGLDALHCICTAPDPVSAWQALISLQQEARNLRLSQMAAQGGLLRFLALVAPVQDTQNVIELGQAYCEKAQWYMEGRFDRSLSIQETADFVGLSRSQLYRVMMETCGISPKNMLRRIRMERAAQMLCATRLTLEEIALRVGLQTGAQLGVSFKAEYGVTPGQYRRDKAQKSDK